MTGERSRTRTDFPAVRPGDGGRVDGVALVTIDRPEAHNALDAATIRQLVTELERLDADEACRVVVITGAGDRAFAGGADIRGMADSTPATLERDGAFDVWNRVATIRVPLVAAVRGYALGGGCELAMQCDLIVAADDAIFGQPEIRLGVIPGAGGTQRLVRALGRARATDLLLTGRQLPASEAAAHGLVSRLAPATEVLGAALALAAEVASMPPLAVRAALDAIDASQELPLSAGLAFEREQFLRLFAT
jgi:enoyl-CoA hydratase